MGHTVSRDRNDPNKFEYELWADFQTIETRGGFASQPEATRAAEAAQRAYLFPAPADAPTLDFIFAEMENDDLLRALFAPEA